MKHVAPLLCALLVCAVTAVAGGVFAHGKPIMAGAIVAAGVTVATLVYQGVRRRLLGPQKLN